MPFLLIVLGAWAIFAGVVGGMGLIALVIDYSSSNPIPRDIKIHRLMTFIGIPTSIILAILVSALA